ncbi:MAG: hypothetical protein GX139_11485 [Armatimonadetes bacterium]|nr:hypothetical protein [Armatimonadota bacterium]
MLKRLSLLVVCAFAVTAITVVVEGNPVIKKAVTTPSGSEKAGQRPYEMVGREDVRAPLVDFQDISGWTVECYNDADAEFALSREQKMWGEFTGKVTYTGKSDNGTVILRAPKPIPVESFNCINMWLNGNVWEWAPEPGSPFLTVSVILVDSDGNEEAVAHNKVRWKEWWLTHAKFPKPLKGKKVSAIKFEGINNPEARSIYLGGLYCYTEELKELVFEPRPARNLTLLPGQSQGLNGTGPGKLPFPTREHTILPSLYAEDYKSTLKQTAAESFEFVYKDSDTEIKYVYDPATGKLGEIVAWVDGKRFCRPMSAGGIEIDGEVASGKLVGAEVDGNELRVTFDLEKNKRPVRVEYIMRLWQKSLVIDFICRGGRATGLALGGIDGVANPRIFPIPYLSFHWQQRPRFLCAGDADNPIFQTVWVDWYRSNASEMYTEQWVAEDSAKINGGVRYKPKTDGRRNDLYERVFLTISPIYEETLPTIANPPSPHGKIAGERLWQESWGPAEYAKEMERGRKLRSYGIEKLTQCNHEITWRDGGESFTMRSKAAPSRGGDEALMKYVAHQKSLGWLSGLYTNYCDMAPVNENWNEDMPQFTPEGDWRPAWPRNYALKPSRAVEMDAKYAKLIKQKYGSNAAYTDVHTAVPPWNYCDYDARVPGAGTFAATFYAYGELLLNDQKVYGPIWSEGAYQCFYAGLASGNYGLMYDDSNLSKEPLNVAFDLLKIHPLECDIGVPWKGQFFREPGWEKPEVIEASVDHFIAATIAYGHIGYLVEETHGIEKACRSYYMLQQLQKRYSMQPVSKIEYADENGTMVSVSHAISKDIINLSRLHVSYQSGLEIFVNGSDRVWTVEGRQLPKWGWYARDKKGDFIEFSALVNGHRVDYVTSPDYEYLDARGKVTSLGGIIASGAVAVLRNSDKTEVIDILGNDEITLKLDADKCIAYDGDGKSLGSAKIKKAGPLVTITTLKDARKYVL